jgi:hypothetical protein
MFQNNNLFCDFWLILRETFKWIVDNIFDFIPELSITNRVLNFSSKTISSYKWSSEDIYIWTLRKLAWMNAQKWETKNNLATKSRILKTKMKIRLWYIINFCFKIIFTCQTFTKSNILYENYIIEYHYLEVKFSIEKIEKIEKIDCLSFRCCYFIRLGQNGVDALLLFSYLTNKKELSFDLERENHRSFKFHSKNLKIWKFTSNWSKRSQSIHFSASLTPEKWISVIAQFLRHCTWSLLAPIMFARQDLKK